MSAATEPLVQLCEQCGSEIDPGDERDVCAGCALPFHAHCLEVHCMECEE